MEHNEKTLSPAALAVAALEAAPDAREGWTVFNAFKHPVFLKAAALLALSSFVSAVFNYAYDTKIGHPVVKDYPNASYMLILVIGGLYIIGKLSPKIIAVLIINAITFIAWNTLFNHNKALLLFNGVAANWGLFYLAMTEPDAMAEFGLRRVSIGGDFTLSLIVSASVFLFLVHAMKVYGLKLQFDALNIIVGVLSSITTFTSIFGLMFLVWKRLTREGLSQTGGMAVLFCLMLCMQIPICAEVYAVRHIPLNQVLVGPGIFAFFMPMFMVLTFHKFKNVFPCIFVVLSCISLLLAAGIT